MNDNGLEAIPIEVATLAAFSDDDLADELRTQSFHLMAAHPIAAAHLVLAAASIAPTCDAERQVADEFSYVIVDFAQQLGVLHRRAVKSRTREQEGFEPSHNNQHQKS